MARRGYEEAGSSVYRMLRTLGVLLIKLDIFERSSSLIVLDVVFPQSFSTPASFPLARSQHQHCRSQTVPVLEHCPDMAVSRPRSLWNAVQARLFSRSLNSLRSVMKTTQKVRSRASDTW